MQVYSPTFGIMLKKYNNGRGPSHINTKVSAAAPKVKHSKPDRINHRPVKKKVNYKAKPNKVGLLAVGKKVLTHATSASMERLRAGFNTSLNKAEHIGSIAGTTASTALNNTGHLVSVAKSRLINRFHEALSKKPLVIDVRSLTPRESVLYELHEKTLKSFDDLAEAFKKASNSDRTGFLNQLGKAKDKLKSAVEIFFKENKDKLDALPAYKIQDFFKDNPNNTDFSNQFNVVYHNLLHLITLVSKTFPEKTFKEPSALLKQRLLNCWLSACHAKDKVVKQYPFLE